MIDAKVVTFSIGPGAMGNAWAQAGRLRHVQWRGRIARILGTGLSGIAWCWMLVAIAAKAWLFLDWAFSPAGLGALENAGAQADRMARVLGRWRGHSGIDWFWLVGWQVIWGTPGFRLLGWHAFWKDDF